MPVSKKFAYLLAAGIIVIIVFGIFNLAPAAFLLYNLILLITYAVDMILTPKPDKLEVERVSEMKLSLGVVNEITVKIRNNSPHELSLVVCDTIPHYMKAYNQEIKMKAAPFSESAGKYGIKPQKRGQYVFSDIYVTYRGLLGLCVKRKIFKKEEYLKVYPNFRDIRRYNLENIKKTQITMGAKITKEFGTGTEFESLREYNNGDDYRKINWMATARRGKLIVNTYQPEKNQQVFAFLDSSRVMNSEINEIKKLDYAINAAFLLIDFVLRNGDNAGLMVFDSQVRRFIKAGKGPSQFELVAENLYNVEENLVSANFDEALLKFNGYVKRRSLLCIFTELFNAEEAINIAKSLKFLARNHIPVIITIKDPRLEAEARKIPLDEHDVLRKSAAIKLINERIDIQKVLLDSGIACIDIEPDKLSVEVLNLYLRLKNTMQI